MEFLNSPEEMREWRAGFEEESDGWDSWAAIWADSTTGTMAEWGARVAVFHLTEDETIGLYRYRSSLFGQMAADSTAGAFCSLGAFADEESLESINLADAGSIMRRTGRSFGRYHEGRQPWVPPVDLETDEAAWAAFVEYLEGISRGQLFDDILSMVDSSQPDPTRDCQVQSELYGLAAERAQDRVGAIRLIDFVRSMDALGVGPLPGTVHATELDYSADPDFGTVVLQAGFTPNPNVSGIVSFGGVVDTSYLGGDCVGYTARAPHVRLMWSGTSNELGIFFTEDAGEDATLVVNLPNASWVCNDDYAGSLDPLIVLENPPEGQYDIWIGSYEPMQFYLWNTQCHRAVMGSPRSDFLPLGPGGFLAFMEYDEMEVPTVRVVRLVARTARVEQSASSHRDAPPRGKWGDTPARAIHRCARLLGFEGAESLASPLGYTRGMRNT